MRTGKQVMMEDALTYAIHRLKKVVQEQVKEEGIIPISLSNTGSCLQKAYCEYKAYMKNPARYRLKWKE